MASYSFDWLARNPVGLDPNIVQNTVNNLLAQKQQERMLREQVAAEERARLRQLEYLTKQQEFSRAERAEDRQISKETRQEERLFQLEQEERKIEAERKAIAYRLDLQKQFADEAAFEAAKAQLTPENQKKLAAMKADGRSSKEHVAELIYDQFKSRSEEIGKGLVKQIKGHQDTIEKALEKLSKSTDPGDIDVQRQTAQSMLMSPELLTILKSKFGDKKAQAHYDAIAAFANPAQAKAGVVPMNPAGLLAELSKNNTLEFGSTGEKRGQDFAGLYQQALVGVMGQGASTKSAQAAATLNQMSTTQKALDDTWKQFNDFYTQDPYLNRPEMDKFMQSLGVMGAGLPSTPKVGGLTDNGLITELTNPTWRPPLAIGSDGAPPQPVNQPGSPPVQPDQSSALGYAGSALRRMPDILPTSAIPRVISGALGAGANAPDAGTRLSRMASGAWGATKDVGRDMWASAKDIGRASAPVGNTLVDLMKFTPAGMGVESLATALGGASGTPGAPASMSDTDKQHTELAFKAIGLEYTPWNVQRLTKAGEIYAMEKSLNPATKDKVLTQIWQSAGTNDPTAQAIVKEYLRKADVALSSTNLPGFKTSSF